MDVGALSTIALNQLPTTDAPSDIGLAVLSKQLDVSPQMGSEMVKALENSVTPYLGGNIDVSV